MVDSVSTLRQFIESATRELQTDSASHPEIVHSLMQQLNFYFPDTFKRLEAEGALQLLNDPEELVGKLRSFLQSEHDRQTRDGVPSQMEQTVTPMSPGEIAKRSTEYADAAARADRKLNNLKTRTGESRTAYARELGKNFTKQVADQLRRESAGATVFDATREDILRKAEQVRTKTDLNEFRNQIKTSVKAEDSVIDSALSSAEIATQKEYALYEQAEHTLERTQEALLTAKQKALTKKSVVNPEEFFSKTIELAKKPSLPVDEVLLTAEVAAWAEGNVITSELPIGGHDFFQTITGPTPIAKRADEVFNTLTSPEKITVIREIVYASLAKSEANLVQKNAADPGSDGGLLHMHQVVRNSIRANDQIAHGNALQKPGERSAALEKHLSTTFSQITINPAVTRSIVAAGSEATSWLNSQAIYAFFLRDKLDIVLGKAGKFAIKEGVQKAAGGVAAKSLGGSIGAWLGTALPLPPGVSNAVGYVVGDVVIGKIISFAGRITNGVVGFFSKAGGIMTVFEGGEPTLLSAIIIAVFLLFFVLPTSLNSSFMADGTRRTALVQGIEGIEGTQPGDNPQLFNVSISAVPAPGAIPTTITYTVSLSSLTGGGIVSPTDITVCFTVFGSTATIPCQTISPSQIAGGSYSFTIPAGQQFDNTVISATVTVTADLQDQQGVTGSSSVSTTIGQPSVECFAFGPAGQADAYGHTSSSWDDKSGVTAAIGILARSPQYMSKVCAGGATITLYRVKADFGGGSVSGPNTIFLYNAGVRGLSAVYTMAHETGHIVNHRTGLFTEYTVKALFIREGPIWTYPNSLTPGEDFAETLGTYVVWKSYTFGSRHGHSGKLNYPTEYPLHYQFAKSVFGIEY